MTIKSIVDLLAQADANLPDNTTGLIDPSDVRTIIKDFLDTISPAYGAIRRVGGTMAVTASPAPITTYTTNVTATAGFYTNNLTNGTVTRSRQGAAGCTDFIICGGAIEGANNAQVRVELYKDAVATGFYVDVVCRGAGRPVGFNIAALQYSTTDPVFDLRIGGDAGTYTIAEASILAQAQPVRSFV